MGKVYALVLCIAALAPVAATFAQTTPPDAGRLDDRPRPAPPQPEPKVVLTPANSHRPVPAAQGSLEVKGYRFSGELNGIGEAPLQALVEGDSGKVITLQALHRVADKVE